MIFSTSVCDNVHDYEILFQWISRTVMVKNNDVDEAMQILNGIMMREGLTKRWKGTRVYEKPTWVGLRIVTLNDVFHFFNFSG